MQLDAEDRLLIKQSFDALAADAKGAAASFYRNLFRIRPDLRRLFVADLDKQGFKFTQMLEVIVSQVGQWGLLRTALEDLAIRHVAYGVTAAHYDAVGEALLAMLRERLGDRSSAATLEAWSKLYAAIGDTMTAYAYPSDGDESEGG